MTDEEKDLKTLSLERAFTNQGTHNSLSIVVVCAGFVFGTLIMGTAYIITTMMIMGLLKWNYTC